MDLRRPIFPTHRSTFVPELFALAISAGVLIRSSPSDLDLQLFVATLALYLAMALLPLRLIANSSNAPNPTTQRWIRHLGTVAVATSFATVVLTIINSGIFSPQAVSWASELVPIILSIGVAVAYKLLINVTPISWFQQHMIKVGIFCLCVAIAGAYNEPLESMASTNDFSSIIYRTYQVHRFVLVPCTFALGVILLTLGIAFPGNSTDVQFVPVMFKEVFASSTLSVGCVILLTGASLMVCASILSSAMVVRVEPGGAPEAIMDGAP